MSYGGGLRCGPEIISDLRRRLALIDFRRWVVQLSVKVGSAWEACRHCSMASVSLLSLASRTARVRAFWAWHLAFCARCRGDFFFVGRDVLRIVRGRVRVRWTRILCGGPGRSRSCFRRGRLCARSARYLRSSAPIRAMALMWGRICSWLKVYLSDWAWVSATIVGVAHFGCGAAEHDLENGDVVGDVDGERVHCCRRCRRGRGRRRGRCCIRPVRRGRWGVLRAGWFRCRAGPSGTWTIVGSGRRRF